ncbi:MAG TPA: hypothetical protein VE172_03750 [Stackebrandtia sp.]|jgi:hypothetical protein|uniref:hypothetical protein n=1 Tax=Stackebrandtia sp. TaxID=2023065 RepID=UPI002D41EA51|nr:hypothetical protein [Stackebrandtia sp.]HZE37903.1 hypothetical protein [Stackebrandtia sp.]
MRTSLGTRAVRLATAAAICLSATGFVLLASTSTASAAQPDPHDLAIHRVNTSSGLISGLDSAMPKKSVSDVVASANRTGTACTAPVSHRAASFCWQSGDSSVKYWVPQGVTSSSDASALSTFDGQPVLLSAWYDNGSNGSSRGVRVSFIDMSSTTTPKYRHVLLVEPTGTSSAPSYKPVIAHAGGLAWYGNQLYVCNSSSGMRVFDMRHILATNNSTDGAIGRQSDGSYAGLGYGFVMPQVAKYQPSVTGGEAAMQFSQVAVDRTSIPNSLVVSEWDPEGTGTRMIRFDVDLDGTASPDSDGIARADWAYVTDFRSMQGATAINGVYYVQRSNGDTAKGGMIKWRPGATPDINDGTLPIGPEDVTYWRGKDQLWSQTEYLGKRYVYASTVSAW